MDDLIRRLRRFGERWPYEEATANLCREAAEAIERLRAEVERLKATIADYWEDES
jgi:hypothetical protein